MATRLRGIPNNEADPDACLPPGGRDPGIRVLRDPVSCSKVLPVRQRVAPPGESLQTAGLPQARHREGGLGLVTSREAMICRTLDFRDI